MPRMSVQSSLCEAAGFWILLQPLQSSSPVARGRTPCAAGAAFAVTPYSAWPANRLTPTAAINHVRLYVRMCLGMALLSSGPLRAQRQGSAGRPPPRDLITYPLAEKLEAAPIEDSYTFGLPSLYIGEATGRIIRICRLGQDLGLLAVELLGR